MRVASFLRVTALAAGALVATAPLASQDAPPRRLKVADTGLPGIDLGLSPLARLEAIGGRSRLRDRAAARAPWVAGRVLVKFRDREHAEAVAIDPSADAEAAARLYRARGDVEFAQADYRAHYDFHPNDPLFANQWNLSALSMERAWDVNPGATSAVIVAVLDGGMAYDTATYQYNARAVSVGTRRYPALGRVTVPFAAAPELTGPNRFVAPRDFIWDDDAPVDLDGHGTHVAGTIGQLTNNGIGVAGMAFNVRLMPVKVIGGDWDFIFGAPNEATTSVVAAGIRYAVDNGAQVINMSIGFEGGGPLPAIEEALRYAVDRGAFVTVSAGNSFEDGNPVEPLAEIAARIERRDVGRRGRPQSRSRPLLELAHVGRDRRAGRRLPRRRRGRRRRPADLRPDRVGGRSAVEPGGALPRAALRRLRLRGLPGHVDGGAARRRPGRAARPAGHHQAGRDRGRDQALRHGSRRRRAVTTTSATA